VAASAPWTGQNGAVEPEPQPRKKRRRKPPSAGYAIGAFVAEIDQRLLRNLPPVEELVAKGDAIRGTSGQAGAFDLGSIQVVLPDDDADRTSAAPSPTPVGRVLHIHTAPSAGQPMVELDRVDAIAGVGLAGDRYATQSGHWSPIARRGERLTLIANEELVRLGTEQGIWLEPGATRRNITTTGIDLDSLIGRRFAIGPVVCQATRRCEPCTYLEELIDEEVLYALVHRAGIRVQILEGGTISVGDPVRLLDD
jgi:MOSC domain-containing protein YiiM